MLATSIVFGNWETYSFKVVVASRFACYGLSLGKSCRDNEREDDVFNLHRVDCWSVGGGGDLDEDVVEDVVKEKRA